MLRSLRSPLALLIVTTTLAWAAPASAKPFDNGDLFVGRTVKISSKDRRFAVGANFQVAPVEAIVQSQVKKLVDEQAAKDPNAKAVVELIKYADTQQIRDLAESGKVDEFKAMLKTELQKQNVTLPPEAQKALDEVTPTKLKALATLVDIYNKPEPTTTFSIEPYASLNLAPVQLTAQVAIAGFHNSRGTSFEVGNLGLDVKTGMSHGVGSMGLGWTVGVSAYAPTGTADADTIALSNTLATPRYAHSYFTYAPYVVLGGDLSFVDVTLRAEYVDMRAVRDKDGDTLRKAVKDLSYLNVGAGVLVDAGMVGISLEIDGLKNIDNAPAMDDVILATAGVRSYLGPVQLGAGVQVPLSRQKSGAGSMGGVNLGEPADVNVLVTGQFKL